jgi:hypothetical protein
VPGILVYPRNRQFLTQSSLCQDSTVMAGVDLKTVQELMGHKTIAMTARFAHLAPTHKLQALETLVRPGSVSVQSGYKLATNTKKPRGLQKLNSLQFIESK